MTEKARQLEALLFVAGEAVTKAELVKLLEVSDQKLESVLAEAAESLSEHGIGLIITGTEVELTTAPSVQEFLMKFLDEGAALSRAASETLAIVAYRGPVTRYDVDMIRGVDSRRMIRQLMQRGVVRREASRGRAPTYDVTAEFFKQVGALRREELPRFEELSSHENVARLLEKP